MWQATMDWEAQDDGVLAKILAPAGTKDIPVGTPVAVIVEDPNDVWQCLICPAVLESCQFCAFAIRCPASFFTGKAKRISTSRGSAIQALLVVFFRRLIPAHV